MNIGKIEKRLKALEENKKDTSKREPFSTLEKFKNGELTGEEAIAILDDGNEPFAETQQVIIKSAILADEKHTK